MIQNNGQSSSRSSVHTLGNTTAAVSSSDNHNFLFDTTTDLSTPDFHDIRSTWSSTNNNINEMEQHKRKRNGSFDSLEAIEKPLPPSQSAVANSGDTQTLLSGLSNDNDNNNADQQEVVPHDSLSMDAFRRPGRKPLSENVFDDDDEDPKAKRKVQNRAAQRAFRERKERYVRDLEMKIRQIQTNHLHTTAQLSQENQFLRSVIHRLKAEICQLKGLPMDSFADGVPGVPGLPNQHNLHGSMTTTSASTNNNGDLAPFLTMGSHAALAPAPAMSRSRPIAIAPAGIPPSPPHNNAKRPIAAAKRRPVPILPQKQEIKKSNDKNPSNNNNTPVQQTQPPQRIYLQNSNTSETYPSSSTTFNASSQPALYVQFSPEEKPQDNFNMHHNNNHNSSNNDSYLPPDVTANLFMNDNNDDLMIFNNASSTAGSNNNNTTITHNHNHHGNSSSSSSSSSGSHGHRSPPLPHQQQPSQPQQPIPNSTSTTTTNVTVPTRIMPQKQDGTEKLVDEQETQQSRVQTVWRRLNLYGRFSDFDFDQLSRVAQMADHRGASQLPMTDGRVPLMEDWELDKLMLQIDSDHL
ncbi:hypothetical protein BDA99DRAFT_495930 [Phascolomyces articulosus]|uniref:BZIP domain-containing protein n=1 Tax=Phascolomyces articulosus TaxID=60185 RepID=A0AAD5PIZ0_9FUNG|nr:hypothetical protein BDA99DRAFT_495930 [Phascolomyces articulosus]